MGLFSKSPKSSPKIVVEGIEIAFRQDYGGWTFAYRSIEFTSFQATFALPTKAELDSILSTLDSLKPEMRKRLQKGLTEWGENSKLDDGESCLVNLEDFVPDKTFTVSWSGGASWGDIAGDFTIKNHEIIDESWGD